MDNFQLGDLNLNFDFDFQHDFTDDENRVIDDILANPGESSGLFRAQPPFDENRTGSSSFFDYLCNDSGSTNDAALLEHNLSNSQMVTFNSDSNQCETHEVVNFPAESEGMTDIQNVNFDWTTFLDESPTQENVPEQPTSIVPPADEPVQNDSIDSSNMICDNGFVYQELKTFDVPEMYANLDQTFGLVDLRKINESMDYSVFENEQQVDQNDSNIGNSSAAPLLKQKLFLLPLHLNQSGCDSLLQVATKLHNHPFILNSMMNKCDDKEANKTQILLPSRPKQIKQKSERYLPVNEQLERINAEVIVLPSIERKLEQRQKRKETPKIDKEKVPVAFAFEVVLTNILENSPPATNSRNKGKTGTNGKKATKPKRSTSSKRRTSDDEFIDEPKPSRRSNKKIKT